MRHWTLEERSRQAEKIRKWQPWSKSTGAKTAEGKSRSKMNALKHGIYSRETKNMRRILTDCRRKLIMVDRIMRDRRKGRRSPGVLGDSILPGIVYATGLKLLQGNRVDGS